MTGAVRARFVGGPLDGQAFDVPDDSWTWECLTFDRPSLEPADSMTSEEMAAHITRHLYDRQLDRLKDGAAEFRYRGIDGALYRGEGR